MFKAEVIAASKNSHGQRITTFLITFPRMILAELNTHRMLSKNSASSRAIPLHKMIDMVNRTPFIPMKWMKVHPGMQGTEYITDPEVLRLVNMHWLIGRDYAVSQATQLWAREVTKQLCNRLLEPFAWHTVLITGTEWENFFALRANPAAEIHMAHLAELMLEVYNNAEVKQLQPGEWHIPFMNAGLLPTIQEGSLTIEEKLKVSTARCAQTSYTLVGDDEKPMDYAKLIALHDRLSKSGHWSPFEHCARAMTSEELCEHLNGKDFFGTDTGTSDGYLLETFLDKTDPRVGWCGNFRGFIQYRKMFENENQLDSRVKH